MVDGHGEALARGANVDNAITTLKDYPAPHHHSGLFAAPLTDGLLLDTLHTAMLCGLR